MENQQNTIEEITDAGQNTTTPNVSIVDLFISGDLDAARAAIHAKTVEIVSDLVKKK